MPFRFLITNIALLMLFANSPARALPAPLYLSVDHWKNCVTNITRGQAQFICLPANKPLSCPQASWKKLSNQHLIPFC